MSYRSVHVDPVPGSEPFRFCEPSWVGTSPPWHIRRLSEAGEKLGGGADTPALCGLYLNRGWDLKVKITEGHLEHSCAACVAEFRKAVGQHGVYRVDEIGGEFEEHR